MRTADIQFANPNTGFHVFYIEGSRIFLPVARRPPGDGYGNGNRTIGGYACYSHGDEAHWHWCWVAPRQIVETLKEFEARARRQREAALEYKRANERTAEQIRSRFLATGVDFDTACEILRLKEDVYDYKRRILLRGENASLYVTAEQLLALIQAAQAAQTKPADTSAIDYFLESLGVNLA